MRAAAVILIVAFGLLAMIRTRFAGLNLYVWFALFRPQEFAWGEVDSLRLSLVVAVTFIGSSIATGIFPDVTHPLSFLMVLFLAPILLAQLTAVDPAVGWFWFQVLLTIIVISLFSVRLTDTRKRFIWLLCIVAGSLGFFGAKYGVGYLIRGGVRFSQGTGGMFGDNNDFALAVSRILFLVIAAAQNAPRWWARWAFAVAAPLCVIGIVSTFSRGGFLGLAVGIVVFLCLQRRPLLAASVVTALVIGGLFVVPISNEYYQRMDTIRTFDEVDDASARSRLYFWGLAVEMVRDHPMGVGLKNYEINYDRYDVSHGQYGRGRAVHSTHFQVLAETGYLGFLIYVGLIGISLTLAFRARRASSRAPGLTPDERRFLFTCANALIASTAAFVAGGSFVSQLLNDLNWITFALVASFDRVSRQILAEAEDRSFVEAEPVEPPALFRLPGPGEQPLEA